MPIVCTIQANGNFNYKWKSLYFKDRKKNCAESSLSTCRETSFHRVRFFLIPPPPYINTNIVCVWCCCRCHCIKCHENCLLTILSTVYSLFVVMFFQCGRFYQYHTHIYYFVWHSCSKPCVSLLLLFMSVPMTNKMNIIGWINSPWKSKTDK